MPTLNEYFAKALGNKATAEQLQHLVAFWESFPENRGRIQALLTVLKRDDPSVEIVPDGADDAGAVPAVAKLFSWGLECNHHGVNVRGKNGEQVWHNADRDGFVRLLVAGKPITVAVAFRNEGALAEIEVPILEAMHRRVEDALCEQLERRGLDSSRIRQSGSVCRAKSPSVPTQRAHGVSISSGCLGEYIVGEPWPDCLGDAVSSLHTYDQVAVLEAKRILERFRLQLEVNSPSTDPEARDKWVYEQAIAEKAWGWIRLRLPKQSSDWESVGTDNGVKDIAFRYANRHDLPPPGPRKSGRPRNTK